MDQLRIMINLYSATTLFVLFVWYVIEDLAGWLPTPLSVTVLLDFICGGILIRKCWRHK